MQRFNVKLFTWDIARKTCCTEINDLGRTFHTHLAVDVYNPRTGDEVRWGHVETIKDGELEVVGWVLEPFDADVKRFPHLADWRMTIYND